MHSKIDHHQQCIPTRTICKMKFGCYAFLARREHIERTPQVICIVGVEANLHHRVEPDNAPAPAAPEKGHLGWGGGVVANGADTAPHHWRAGTVKAVF